MKQASITTTTQTLPFTSHDILGTSIRRWFWGLNNALCVNISFHSSPPAGFISGVAFPILPISFHIFLFAQTPTQSHFHFIFSVPRQSLLCNHFYTTLPIHSLSSLFCSLGFQLSFIQLLFHDCLLCQWDSPVQALCILISPRPARSPSQTPPNPQMAALQVSDISWEQTVLKLFHWKPKKDTIGAFCVTSNAGTDLLPLHLEVASNSNWSN